MHRQMTSGEEACTFLFGQAREDLLPLVVGSSVAGAGDGNADTAGDEPTTVVASAQAVAVAADELGAGSAVLAAADDEEVELRRGGVPSTSMTGLADR